MSSHWKWAEALCKEHARLTPFAPENGSPLRFKTGDPVIVTNDAGVGFLARVTGLYATDMNCPQYASGKRYLLNWACHWFPVAETSLAIDPMRDPLASPFNPAFLAGVQDQLESGVMLENDARMLFDVWCGCPTNL